jgi:NADPH:quinone reductase-like Zn-dependent oxidoreductase
VCIPRNVEQARSLGADHVIDYTREDFTRSGQRYDLMLDIAGGRSWSECKRVLDQNATLVAVGGPKKNRLMGPLGDVIKMRLASLGGSRRLISFLSDMNKEDLLVLNELFEARKVTPVVERTYALSEAPEAFRYLGQGHAQGKIVITV